MMTDFRGGIELSVVRLLSVHSSMKNDPEN